MIIRLLLFFLLTISSFRAIAQNKPDTVKIGCYLISLHDFNFRDKEYTARFWVWMLYNNKKFDLQHQVEIPNAKTMEKPDVVIEQLDSLDWLQMKIKCVMKQGWKVNHYPFDTQNLKIYIENSTFDSNDLVFKSDTAGKPYDPNLVVDGWQITDFKVHTDVGNYATTFGDPSLKGSTYYSRFVIDIGLQRDAWGLFIKVFLGMYVAFCIAFVGFFIDHENIEPRFGLPVGGVFASVGNKYVIDSLLPESSQLTLVDLLHGLTLICIFLIIAYSAFSLRLFKQGEVKLALKLDKIIGSGIFAFFCLTNLILILLAIS